MKQVVQNYKVGKLSIEEVPEPVCKAGGVLVHTFHSVISAGTEKMKVDDSKKSYIGMAKSHPDKVKQVLETYQQVGPVATYRKVMNRLDSFTPLGYSLAGKVIEVGANVSDFQIGDMVACAGAGIANHAEINWIPKNLCCKIPLCNIVDNADENGLLSTEMASFVTVGAIAMQGVRQADVRVGETVAVIGLGLIGLLACLILKASGCSVVGIDLDEEKVNLAKDIGVDTSCTVGGTDIEQLVNAFSDGHGADAVLVTTGTTSNEPILLAGNIARDRATIVDVGINKMDIPWQLYYEKELVLKQSRSYGPGRYDPNYEFKGHDYPIGYVRWTEKRNMDSFLKLVASGKIDLSGLITHRFDFNNASDAYSLIEGERSEFYVGIVLKYDVSDKNLQESRIKTIIHETATPAKGFNLGMIGAGNFARTMLLPYLKSNKVNLVGIATATGLSARDTARKFGFSISSTDYTELLKNPDINSILIATRHNLHAKLVIDSLKAGKNVYTEKPLCISKDELGNISACYNDLNSGNNAPRLMVGFNRRHAPLIIKTKSFFKKRMEPMVMHYRVNAGFMKKTEWYQDLSIGGGRIIGEVCHFIDVFQFLADSLPVSVFARSIKTDNESLTPEDNIIITIVLADGSIGSISYLANGDSAYSKEYLEVFCENSIAIMDNFTKLTTARKGKKKTHKSTIQDKGHKAEMSSLIEMTTGNKPVPITFESLYATTLATFQIRESLKKNEMVAV